MLEDQLAQKLSLRQDLEDQLDKSLSVIDEEGSQTGGDDNLDLSDLNVRKQLGKLAKF